MSEESAKYGVVAMCESPQSTLKIKIKKLHPDAVIPRKATDKAIGYDLFVPCDICIEHTRQVISLGFAIELPDGYEAKIEPRSGFSSKGIKGFELMNVMPDGRRPYDLISDNLWQRIDKSERFNADVLVGKIDPDYRGEVGVIIHNSEPSKHFLVAKGTRIAQMTIYKTEAAEFEPTDELSDTDRGAGGFGSTGS